MTSSPTPCTGGAATTPACSPRACGCSSSPAVGHRIGRVVSAPAARGTGAAAALMRAALVTLPGPVVLGAQVRVRGFYERLGFVVDGPGYDEDGIPHVPMLRAVHRRRSGAGGIVDGVLTVLLFLLVVAGLVALAVTRRTPRAVGAGPRAGGASGPPRPTWTPRRRPAAGTTASAARCSRSPAPTSRPGRRSPTPPSATPPPAPSSRPRRRPASTASSSTPPSRACTSCARRAPPWGWIPAPSCPRVPTGRGRASSPATAASTSTAAPSPGRPSPSAQNSHYYPGGSVAGRPVAAGWYSEPWWKPMLLGGAGAVGGVLLADALFSGFGGGGFGGFDGGGFGGGGFDGAASTGVASTGWLRRRASTAAASTAGGSTAASAAGDPLASPSVQQRLTPP